MLSLLEKADIARTQSHMWLAHMVTQVW